MQFSLFSVVALAASAFAVPIAQPAVAQKSSVDKAARGLDLVGTVRGVVDEITSLDITDTASVVNLLTVVVGDVKTETSNIKDILSSVDLNTLTKADAVSQVVGCLSNVNGILLATADQLTGVVGLHITGSDVKAILSLVLGLVNEVVAVVEEVVAALGLESAISVILSTVFQAVAGLLTLVTGLVGGIIPGLIDTVTPILEAFDGSALGSLLTPVAGVLEGLTE